jgi:glycerol-3-phosphate cytidylyltransferase
MGCQSYKNKTPIIPFKERIAIVSELKCVDQTVPQTSMNKMDAWNELHFDALFHGSDWKGSDMYNKMTEEFAKVGVDVVFLSHTEGVSSTLLSEVLRKINEGK